MTKNVRHITQRLHLSLEECYHQALYFLVSSLYPGNSLDSELNNKWVWWSVPSESQLYKNNGDNWLLYSKKCFGRHYYYSNPVKSCLIVHAPPISIFIETSSSYKVNSFQGKWILHDSISGK